MISEISNEREVLANNLWLLTIASVGSGRCKGRLSTKLCKVVFELSSSKMATRALLSEHSLGPVSDCILIMLAINREEDIFSKLKLSQRFNSGYSAGG